MKKLAILSHAFPPNRTGHAIVLYKLLKSWKPDDYCLITNADFIDADQRGKFKHSKEWLSAPYYQLPSDIKLKTPRVRLISISVSLFNLFTSVLRRGWRTARIVRKEQCKAVLACSGNIANIPAGFLASRLARTEFDVYIFDDYTYQWTSRFYRWFASRVERRILHLAKTVIVPNEYLAASYQERYGIKATVIHNPTLIPSFKAEMDNYDEQHEIEILYTGSIYHAHYDAFRDLIEAVNTLDIPQAKIHIYSEQSPQELAEVGIRGPLVFHQMINNEEVRFIQHHADILFLPLAFESEIPEIIRTSAPGKMGEYLASGTPVLVHAPSDSYISWYFKHYQCGLVVNQNDPSRLREAILKLVDDNDFRVRIVNNALQRAKEDFSLQVESEKFIHIFYDGDNERK
jgi:glycosyltransferase involved in cell wall biosynthesis